MKRAAHTADRLLKVAIFQSAVANASQISLMSNSKVSTLAYDCW